MIGHEGAFSCEDAMLSGVSLAFTVELERGADDCLCAV